MNPAIAFIEVSSSRILLSQSSLGLRRFSFLCDTFRTRGGGPEICPRQMSSANSVDGNVAAAQPVKAEIADVPSQEDKMKTIVMYVILRRDLKWPLGSVVAQGAHAATAVLWEV